MKKQLASILSASVVMLATTAAEAQNRWPNWYVGLHGALTFVGEEDIEDSAIADSYDSDNGFGYGATLGYRIPATAGEWSKMRVEVQWHHQRSDNSSVTVPGGASLASGGETRVNAGMFNIFYDAATSMDNVRPYVGLGLGYAQLRLVDTLALVDEDSVFAWNLMAGIGYIPQSLPFTEFYTGYRYFATGEGDFAFADGSTFSMGYDSHNIEAGVRFLF